MILALHDYALSPAVRYPKVRNPVFHNVVGYVVYLLRQASLKIELAFLIRS
ncbi:hypothetical protein D3C77_337330 [compost metagenome]